MKILSRAVVFESMLQFITWSPGSPLGLAFQKTFKFTGDLQSRQPDVNERTKKRVNNYKRYCMLRDCYEMWYHRHVAEKMSNAVKMEIMTT